MCNELWLNHFNLNIHIFEVNKIGDSFLLFLEIDARSIVIITVFIIHCSH